MRRGSRSAVTPGSVPARFGGPRTSCRGFAVPVSVHAAVDAFGPVQRSFMDLLSVQRMPSWDAFGPVQRRFMDLLSVQRMPPWTYSARFKGTPWTRPASDPEFHNFPDIPQGRGNPPARSPDRSGGNDNPYSPLPRACGHAPAETISQDSPDSILSNYRGTGRYNCKWSVRNRCP